MSLELLKKSLLESSVVKKRGYSYVIHPLTDGIPEIKPELLTEVANELEKKIEKYGKIDKIVTIESMGIPLATMLSFNMNIPFIVIRKRSYGLSGEKSAEQVTGYSKSKLYINNLCKGDEIVIVDDLVSTGGTLRAVLSVLKEIDVVTKGVFIAIGKGNTTREIMDEFNVPITTLVDIDIVDEKVVLKT